MKTYWVATRRYCTMTDKEMYSPLPYADVSDIDASRVFNSQEECEEWCRATNNRQKER